MPRVFIHGNPETSAIWTYVVEALAARGVSDLVLLSPPGFGSPRPPEFTATRAAYCGWVVGELERIGEPVDLVGHDWGALHVYGVLAERPDLVRTWAADCAGALHSDYVWHDMARVWQTPEAGEEAVAAMVAAPAAERAGLLAGLGIPPAVAAQVAAGLDEATGRCILDLYRSAAQPAMADLGRRFSDGHRPPGLVIIPTEDPYAGTPVMAEEVATSVGATTMTLDGMGHWWMFDGATAVADALVAHWHNAGGAP